MSPDDILIAITVSAEHPIQITKTFDWPPRITHRQVTSPLEGLPARIGEYSGSTRIKTLEVVVTVFFGRAHPTDRQLRRANAELHRAHIA
jgi:hypothetical protein